MQCDIDLAASRCKPLSSLFLVAGGEVPCSMKPLKWLMKGRGTKRPHPNFPTGQGLRNFKCSSSITFLLSVYLTFLEYLPSEHTLTDTVCTENHCQSVVAVLTPVSTDKHSSTFTPLLLPLCVVCF